jgi:uncharacterized membrane protein
MVFGAVILPGFWLTATCAVGNRGRTSTHDRTSARRQDEPTALQILERRYAEGELTDAEFEKKRLLLRESIKGERPG